VPKRPPPVTAPRKLPVQARSTDLVAAIRQAAIRVLEREGAPRFTTVRVAEEAGVSVGSLYQYFPNKHAILFRLQLDEWEATGATLDAILGDRRRPPAQRLRDTFRAFFHSECDEAPLRLALDDAAPSYRDAPESRAGRRRSGQIVSAFVVAAAPRASARQRTFAAELIFTTMTALGQQVSERRPTRAEVDRWADAVADMLSAYLAQLAPPGRRRRSS
jgi:AcrR family transcriptional regulator